MAPNKTQIKVKNKKKQKPITAKKSEIQPKIQFKSISQTQLHMPEYYETHNEGSNKEKENMKMKHPLYYYNN
jgi:hypothetical protein